MPNWKKLIVSGSDASLSSLTTTGKLQLNSSETGSTIFEVNGVNGRLFTITDEMSGSLFNISTTAGLPVIEALSDGKITLGPFSAQTEIDTSGNLELGGNISGSATSIGSFGRVEADTEVLTPMLTFDSHTSTNRNINVKSGSTSIRVSENFSVGADNTINIEDDGRLILVPPSFFIT